MFSLVLLISFLLPIPFQRPNPFLLQDMFLLPEPALFPHPPPIPFSLLSSCSVWACDAPEKRDQGGALFEPKASLRRPRFYGTAQVALSEAQRPGQPGRLFFAYFSLAKQRKVKCRRATPGQQSQASYEFNSCLRRQTMRKKPKTPRITRPNKPPEPAGRPAAPSLRHPS